MPRLNYGVARVADTVYIGRVTTNNKGSTYVTGHAADLNGDVLSFFNGRTQVKDRDAKILIQMPKKLQRRKGAHKWK